MDPVGSWSAYAASYNRLANAGGFQNASSSDLHHHMGGSVQPVPASTSQFLAAHATSGLANSAASPFNPTGFLSPPPVGYDPVFNPLFHQKAHYGIQPRTPLKQPETDPYNQMTASNFYEQNNGPSIPWSQNSAQLPSPFGILPHESVVANSSGAPPKAYENINAHFAATQSISDYKNSPFLDPKKRSLSPPKASLTSAAPFFQQMFTPPSDVPASFKQNEYLSKNYQNGHAQSCDIASPPSSTQSKEYRMPQAPRPQFPQQRPEKSRAFTPKQAGSKSSKHYEAEKRNDTESQSSPISYAMMDSQRGFQSTKGRSHQYHHVNQQSYRFPMTPESDYQRSKSTESFGSSSSNPDCNIGLPRRPSPLHAQQSPSIPAQSPAYSMYNSPLTSISSTSPVQHEAYYNKQHPEATPPLDVSRNGLSNSVISRMESRYDRQEYSRQQWDERLRRYQGYDTQNLQNRQQYYDPNNQISLQDLSSCRGDPMSLVKNLQQQQPEKPVEDAPKKRKRSSGDKIATSDHMSRVPPPAHHNANQVNQNGFLESDRWNMHSASNKMYSAPSTAFNSQASSVEGVSNQPSSLVMPHSGSTVPYYHGFNDPESQASDTPVSTEIQQVKVIVPNIAEELKCLLENAEPIPKKPLIHHTNSSYRSSFIKFIQGVKESSPPPKRNIPRLLTMPHQVVADNVPEFPSDPQDDPRYFPLPKSSDKRNFNSSDTECSDDNNEKSIQQEGTPVPAIVQEDKPLTNREHRKKKKKDKKHKKKKKKSKRKDFPDYPETVVPRRELARRKAKEKSRSLIDDIDAEHRIPELHGSDSDPSWSPEEGSDNSCLKRSRRISMRRRTSFKESSDDEDMIKESTPERETRRTRRISISASIKPSDKNQKKQPPQIIYPSKSKSKTTFPFNIGDFVVLKSDTNLLHPPIWKVTEKTMLQKFIHFVEKGMSFYENLRFFTGWSPENKKVYEGVIVKVVSKNKMQQWNLQIVELLADNIPELEEGERNIVEKIVEESASYYENFEVYVQTLFSQALDSNFLNEIYQENDEYFLDNVRAIENVVNDMEKRLIEGLDWGEEVLHSIQTLSSYKGQQKGGKTCHCRSPAIQLVTLSGIPYDKDTLEADILSTPRTEEVLVCRSCLTNLEVLHSLSHFKFSLYSLCETKVNESREEDKEKDATVILNEMLADEAWHSQLFLKVRQNWGYAETLIEKLKNFLSSPS